MIFWIASVLHVSFMWYRKLIHQSHLVVRDGIVQNFYTLTSPGTLYFFSTCPDSQSITHKVSPPHVATVREPPLTSNRLKAMPNVQDQKYIQAYSWFHLIQSHDSAHHHHCIPAGAQRHRPKVGCWSRLDCPVDCDTAGHGTAADSPAPVTAGERDAH